MTRTLIAFRALSVRSRSLSCSECALPPQQQLVILYYLTYLQDLRVFERVYAQHDHDLRRTLDTISVLAEDVGQPFEAVRSRVRPSVRLRQQPFAVG